MGSLPHEALQVLYLDNSRILIAQEYAQQGSAVHLLLSPKAIFRRAFALDASAMILAHNHPSGDASPSVEDIRATDALVSLGQTLGVEIIEHIIVARDSCHAILQGPRLCKPARLAAFFDLRDSGVGRLGHATSTCAGAAANAQTTAMRRLQRRELLGNPSLLANPAWDMLIDLFLHTHADKPVSTSALCIGSGLPMSSALRLVRKLCDANLVLREPDPADGRRKFIRLTPRTWEGLNRHFCVGPD
ncbi:winged helix DNA-binding domain protein (plasmid) [Blastomonas sp. RAC04]|nr:winged helix DNA-binding domain protein [Blastomonas sp. RAC04]